MNNPDFSMNEANPQDVPAEIAGFWRRTGAFLLDCLVIGLVGLCLGLFLHKQFEAMGEWGRVVGFLVALAYFGVMESRICQTSTLGKRALGIKVITAGGAPLSVGKALLRSAVFFVPYFLNGINPGAGYTGYVLPAILTVLIFGLGVPIVYLYLFNRRTRQSLHDLLVGAVVVRAGTAAAPRLLPVWRGHMVTVAALFALMFAFMIGGVAFYLSKIDNGTLRFLMLVQQQVSRLPEVRNASINDMTQFATGNKRFHYLAINAVTRGKVVDEKALAGSIAEIALTTYPRAQQMDACSVTLVHGYDIGIASRWTSKTFNGSPGDWRQERVGK